MIASAGFGSHGATGFDETDFNSVNYLAIP